MAIFIIYDNDIFVKSKFTKIINILIQQKYINNINKTIISYSMSSLFITS